MATRRRYKQPPGYRDGGRVLPVNEAVETTGSDVKPSSPPPPAAPPSSPAVASDHSDDALQQAIAGVRRAEEINRAHAQTQQPAVSSTIEEFVDGIPGLSEFKKGFLKANPEFVTDATHQQLLRKNYQEALRGGVADDDTPEMSRAILDGVARDLEQMRQQGALRSELLRSDEPTRLVSTGDTQNAAATDLPPRTGKTALSTPPTIRKSMPVTAPVSRDVPTTNGQRYSSQQVHLNAEERQVAHISFRHLPPDQAEAAYAANKIRMLQMKADGVIQGDR